MTICYFGIYNPDFSRNKIYIKALKKAGHSIIECRDDSRGLIKFWHLYKKHHAIKNDYDEMVVGYPGHIVVPFAKLISKKRVIVDALGSLYDAEIYSHKPNFIKKMKSRLADWLMVKFADKILLESIEQKKYFENKFGKSEKYEVLYTGTDEEVFQLRPIKQRSAEDKFTVLFRGKLTPESGIVHVLDVAKILKENSNIIFRIIGYGYFLEKIKELILKKNLKNVDLISKFLPEKELIQKMSDADLILGQFEDNPRLNRTIPHKAYEAFAMGIPYITGDAPAIREIMENNKSVFLVPLANPQALAQTIESLSTKPELLKKVAEHARQIFNEKFSFNAIMSRWKI